MEKIDVGQKAPAFNVKNQDGKIISSKELNGEKYILFFYPKDNTPGCTLEACNLRDNYKDLKEMGFNVFGISIDSEKKHQNFITKFDLPFDLLADIDHEMVNDFGVWGLKKTFGKEYEGIFRTTYLIDEKGSVMIRIDKVDTKNHTEQIKSLLNDTLS